MNADAITFARAADRTVTLAKGVVVADGAIVRRLPSPQVGRYAFREVAVGNLAELAAAIEEAAGRGEIAVRGRPKGPTGRRAVYDDPDRGPAGLDVVPRRWCSFDWDTLPADRIEAEPIPPHLAADEAEYCSWADADPLLDGETGALHALRRLPPPFRDVSCLWQISASAGYEPGFRLRTWHWLDRATTGAELKAWLAPAIGRGLVDPVTLVEAQPHYLGVRVQGGPDPCPRRFGLLHLARAEVPVPDIAAIRRRRDERERAERPPPPARLRVPAGYAAEAQRQIDECIAAVRVCTALRHPNYKRQVARSKALADRHGLDWAPIRAELIAAYESTLPATEARRRRASSTEGVPTWLERRAPA